MKKTKRIIPLSKLMKLSKSTLIKRITKTLRSLPKEKLCRICYEVSKSQLPKLHISKKKMPKLTSKKSKTKRKLKPGIHTVTIKGKKRKVRVLRNGQWRFLKS